MKKIFIYIIAISILNGEYFYIDVKKDNDLLSVKNTREWKQNKKTKNMKSESISNNTKTKFIKIKITQRPLCKINWKYKNYEILNKQKIKTKYYIDEEKDYLYIQNTEKDLIENFIIKAERTEETIKNPNFKN